MRIATWNVNSLKARLKFVLGWLQIRQPDIVCIQELKLADDSFPHEALRDAGYGAVVHGQPQWNGVAILHRLAEPRCAEAELLQAGLPDAAEDGARFVAARVGELWVGSAYVPNGKTTEHADFKMKLAWMAKLHRYVADTDCGELAILGGDFNIVPAAVDTFVSGESEQRIFHTPAERDAIGQLLENGWTDLYRALEPDGRMFSWWDYRAGSFHKNLGLRIDLLLASPGLRERCESVLIDRDYRKKKEGETPSDHAPVIAEFGG